MEVYMVVYFMMYQRLHFCILSTFSIKVSMCSRTMFTVSHCRICQKFHCVVQKTTYDMRNREWLFMFSERKETKMILRMQNTTARLCYRQLSSTRGFFEEQTCNSIQSKSLAFADSSSISSVVASVASVNPRLSALNLTAQYLSGGSYQGHRLAEWLIKVT